jgi:hypothetical protein
MKLGNVLVVILAAMSGGVAIGPGEDEVIELSGVRSVAVDNPSIARAEAISGGVRVTGVTKGTTVVHVRRAKGALNDYTVNVGDLKLEGTFTLSKGGSTTLPLVGIHRLAVTDPDVVAAQPEGAGLKILGISKGEALLEVWTGKARTTWRIEVKD